MAKLKDLFQEADWKLEKHSPVIESSDFISKGEVVPITISVGKEIAHPNTSEHHIVGITIYFLPKGEKFPYQVGKYEFNSHGASIQGPNTSGIYTEPKVTLNFQSDKPGTIIAVSYCNIHGLWESSKEIGV
ncbi:MAG: class II SORL domain-containing protein [Candidatus Omnitrophica bacterium]|nr:class II SORL domain-containing protein [Candidatus Omnitrophota bacterium]MCK5287675.1 class II SORL domain-containing protein [Candidatus Omnitrophota bacterium]MCK5492857.1 class II SORL domain-containing protein [Candidatus Omnitrophota bacterium]